MPTLIAFAVWLMLFIAGTAVLHAQETGGSEAPAEGLDAWSRKYRPYDHDAESDALRSKPRKSLMMKRRTKERSRELWQRRRMMRMIEPGVNASPPGNGSTPPGANGRVVTPGR